MTTERDIAAIEARAEAATPGPWWSVDLADSTANVYAPLPPPFTDREDAEAVAINGGKVSHGACSDVDAEFIAHARTDMPDLLAMVAERDAVIGRVRELHVPYWTDIAGVQRNHYVIVYKFDGEESDLPADHVCVTEGWDLCMDEEHMVLACTECRVATDDGEPGYLLWPCSTRKALDRVALGDGDTGARTGDEGRPG